MLESSLRDLVSKAAALALCALLSSAAPGADFVVSNLDDSGPGSLRQAILDANATTDEADTITFDVEKGMINISSSLYIKNSGIGDSLNIIGPGNDYLTIRFNDFSGAHLEVESGPAGQTKTEISDLRFTGNSHSSTSPGVDIGSECEVKFNNMNFYNIVLNSSLYGGGAIRNNGSLEIENSIFSRNEASWGGGIYNKINGMVKISNSSISDCIASDEGGAGIYNDGAMELENVIVSNNIVLKDGGGCGIFNNGNIIIKNSLIDSNEGGGGGVAIKNEGTAIIFGTTISGHRPLHPQSPYSNGYAIVTNGTMTIANSLIDRNSSNFGGAINNKSQLTLFNVTISRNGPQDGGIRNTGNLRAHSCTIIRNSNSGINNLNGAEAIISNTIIASNDPNVLGRFPNIRGDFISDGFNLIGDIGEPEDSTGFVDGENNDLVNYTDLEFLPLANNGGTTQTYALPVDSPAIGAGDTYLPFDQREVSRPSGGVADGIPGPDTIGAFEFNAPAAAKADWALYE